MRASIAYKGSWARRARSFARDVEGGTAMSRADAWLQRLSASIVPGTSLAQQIAAAAAGLPGATIKSWMAESCIGSYPLEVVASSRTPDAQGVAAGAFVVLTIELSLDGIPWLGAAPAFVGNIS